MPETFRGLWFLLPEDLACDWLQHNKHSKHILGVQGFVIEAVRRVSQCRAENSKRSHKNYPL